MEENTSKNSNLIGQTLEQIFSNHKHVVKNKDLKAGIELRELELAFTVLLVDLASCDQNFDQDEYQVISKGLIRVFGTSKDQVTALVNQANLVISNMRGTNRFAEMLRDNLSTENKEKVLEIIDEIIQIDGVEDGFETYLRAKFVSLLGLEAAAAKEQLLS
ncbi:MAG: TerB family tellurite resistance protein [Bdellovibrionales bacterium]|nr:TerB family tellurite resistance protein [Bdellovibrionales bacterium]